MTELLERAVETVRALPPETQDEIARMLLELAGAGEPDVDLTEEEEAAVLRSREAAARGEFATDEQVRAVRAKHGLYRFVSHPKAPSFRGALSANPEPECAHVQH